MPVNAPNSAGRHDLQPSQMRSIDRAGDSSSPAGTLGDGRTKVSDADLSQALRLRQPGHLICFKPDTDAAVVHRDRRRVSPLGRDLLLHVSTELKVLRVREPMSDDRRFQSNQGSPGLPNPLHGRCQRK